MGTKKEEGQIQNVSPSLCPLSPKRKIRFPFFHLVARFVLFSFTESQLYFTHSLLVSMTHPAGKSIPPLSLFLSESLRRSARRTTETPSLPSLLPAERRADEGGDRKVKAAEADGRALFFASEPPSAQRRGGGAPLPPKRRKKKPSPSPPHVSWLHCFLLIL